MNIIDVLYERACMATPRDEYYTKMLETLIDHNDRHNAPLSSEKLQQAVSKVMAETEEEECEAERNANNVTMDTFLQSPVTIYTQRKYANGTNERRIASYNMKETIKEFHGLTIQSTISDSAYYDSEEHAALSNPKIDSSVATNTSDRNERKITETDTTNRNYSQKLILNRLIPNIIPGATRTIDQTIMEDVAGIRETLEACQTVLSKEIVMDAAHSGAHMFWTPRKEAGQAERAPHHGTETPSYRPPCRLPQFKWSQ